MYDVTVIGAAILDVLAQPVSPDALKSRSFPADCISMSIGGDAANEATILARLGKRVSLITKLGTDLTGSLILDHCRKNGISTEDTVLEEDLPTGINIVLVDEQAERSFITNRQGSLRRLALSDVSPEALEKTKIVSFASIFVSPLFDTAAMASLFHAAKEQGCILCADMTRCKNQERVEDIREALSYVDYLFPNYEEAKAVTGKEKLEEIADAFLECGTGCVVIKTGRDGCFVKNRKQCFSLPVYPGTRCIDTTGAGDNFAAGFLYALSEQMELKDCARFATAAASIAVEAVGACTGIRSLGQVRERFQKLSAETL